MSDNVQWKKRVNYSNHIKIKGTRYYNEWYTLGDLIDSDKDENSHSYLLIDGSIHGDSLADKKKVVQPAKESLRGWKAYILPWVGIFAADDNKEDRKLLKQIHKNCCKFLNDMTLLLPDTELFLILFDIVKQIAVPKKRYPCAKDYLFGFLIFDYQEILQPIIQSIYHCLSREFLLLEDFKNEHYIYGALNELHYFGNIYTTNCKLNPQWNICIDPCTTASIFRTCADSQVESHVIHRWFSYNQKQDNKLNNELIASIVTSNITKQKEIAKIFKIYDDHENKDFEDATAPEPISTGKYNFDNSQWNAPIKDVHESWLDSGDAEQKTKVQDIKDDDKWYKNSKLYSKSSKHVKRRVARYYKKFFNHKSELFEQNLFIPEILATSKFAGPFTFEYLEHLFIRCLNSELKMFYGILCRYYSVVYDIAPENVLLWVIVGLSPGRMYELLIDILYNWDDIDSTYIEYVTTHVFLRNFGIAIISNNNEVDCNIPFDWIMLCHTQCSCFEWTLYMDMIGEAIVPIWQTMEWLYSANGPYSITVKSNDNILAWDDIIQNVIGNHKKRTKFWDKMKSLDVYIEDFSIEKKYLNDAIRLPGDTTEKRNDFDNKSARHLPEFGQMAGKLSMNNLNKNKQSSIESKEYERMKEVFNQIQRNKLITTNTFENFDKDTIYAPSDWDDLSVCSDMTTRTDKTMHAHNIPNNEERKNNSATKPPIPSNMTRTIVVATADTNPPFPTIDITGIHKPLVTQHFYYKYSKSDAPGWFTDYTFNHLLWLMNKWCSYYEQYNLTYSKQDYAANRKLTSKELWKTGEIKSDNQTVYGGVKGIFANKHDYLTVWANEPIKYLQIEDGLLKNPNFNWYSLVTTAYNQHVNIARTFWPTLKFATRYDQVRLFHEISFINAVKVNECCKMIAAKIQDFDYNKELLSQKEETVFERRLTTQKLFLQWLQVK